MALKKVLLIISIGFLISCNEPTFWVLSISGDSKPITGCLSMDEIGVSSIIISMNCQKTGVAEILLCSQNRLVQSFKSKTECEDNFKAILKANGKYQLADDPYNKL